MAGEDLILVTGATGAVGPRIVAALVESGCNVRTLSLDRPQDQWPGGVDAKTGDVTDPAAVRSAMQGVAGVIHLAALLHIVNPPPELRPRYERINVGGTANVVEAALDAGVRRLVLFSTINVYGASSPGTVLTEDSPLRPDSFYAQTKVDAERIVLAAKRADGAALGTVLRLGAVYGPRIKGNYRRLLLALARRRFIPIGPGTNRRTLVCDADVARAALLALHHPTAAGRIYNVTDGHLHTMNGIIATLCGALGRRKPLLSLPAGPVRALAKAVDAAAGSAGLKPPSLGLTVEKYLEDVAVSGDRIRDELGFAPQYDLASGWGETVSHLRNRGEI